MQDGGAEDEKGHGRKGVNAQCRRDIHPHAPNPGCQHFLRAQCAGLKIAGIALFQTPVGVERDLGRPDPRHSKNGHRIGKAALRHFEPESAEQLIERHFEFRALQQHECDDGYGREPGHHQPRSALDQAIPSADQHPGRHRRDQHGQQPSGKRRVHQLQSLNRTRKHTAH